MAVEVEASGQLEEFLAVLKRRIWWILVPLVLIATLGIAFAVIVPKKYVSESKVLVRDSRAVGQGGNGDVSILEGQTAPYVIQSLVRVKGILGNNLGWDEYKALRKEDAEEYARATLRALRVSLIAMPKDSGQQIVELSFSHTQPDMAQQFLSAVIETWKSEVETRYRTSEEARKDTLLSTKRELEAEREELNRQMTQVLRANNLSNAGRGAENRPTVAQERQERLQGLETQAEADQDALLEKRRLLETRIAQRDAEPEYVPERDLPDQAPSERSERIAYLQSEIDRLELELNANNWLTTHSKYKTRRAEIDSLQKQIDGELARGVNTSNGSGAAEVLNPERLRLTNDVSALEREIEALEAGIERSHERIELLKDEIQDLARADVQLRKLNDQLTELSEIITRVGEDYEVQRAHVASIDSDRGNFFEDQIKPTLPVNPSEPNPVFIGALSVLFGLAFGLGLAILLEYSKSTFRTARDLSRVMVVPVLGTVNNIVTRRQRARSFFLRSALGTLMVAYVFVVGYVVWTYETDKTLLSPEIADTIEAIRKPFM